MVDLKVSQRYVRSVLTCANEVLPNCLRIPAKTISYAKRTSAGVMR